MWFENAMGNEKIKFMFNNEFSMDSIQLESFKLHYHFTLQLHFLCKLIPGVFPEKWKKEKFNAISLTLSLGDILSFEVKGNEVGFICSLDVITSKEKSSINIVNNDFHLQCESRFLTIEGITPYIDERWD